MPLEALTDAEFAQYQREGYVVKRGLFDADTVSRVRERLREYTHGNRPVEEFEQQLEPEAEDEGVDAADAVRKFEGLGLLDDAVVHDLATDDRLVTVAQDLLGPDVKLLRSAAMFKPPGVGSEKGLHQDSAYYPVRPYDQVTTWIALDDATPENGCMEVLPGGHTEGLLETRPRSTRRTSSSSGTSARWSSSRWSPATCSSSTRCSRTGRRRTRPTGGGAR
nr:phytanoyl-CoA dioxygenase family protein [Haloglomus sp. DT116]